MLKTSILSQVLVANKVLAANEVDVVEGGDKSIENCRKLSKTGKLSKSQKLSKLGKSKSKKTSKSWNLTKLRKKLSKSRNLTNFGTTENGSKFLTPDARITFNCLRLAFTKAPILWHFDLECHIQIETNTSNYAISDVLNQLASETRSDRVVTKTNLGQ